MINFRSKEEVIPGFSFGVTGDVKFAVKVNETKTLIGTDSNYLYLHGSDGLEIYKSDVDDYLRAFKITTAKKVERDVVAIGTKGGGCVIIDISENKEIYVLNQQSGLPDNKVESLYMNDENGLWIGHRYGVTRVAWNIPVHKYSIYPGITGKITSISYASRYIVCRVYKRFVFPR